MNKKVQINTSNHVMS